MSLHHNPRMVTGNMELHLDAADRMSYPGSGATWYDLSGNGRHLTLINGPTVADKYLKFDGTSEYAERTGVGLSLTSFTIDTVVRPTSNGGSYRAFFSATESTQNDYLYGINWDMGPSSSTTFNAINVEISRNFGGFYNRDIKTSSTPFNTWVHLVITVDAGLDTYIQYVNGVAEYTGTYNGTITYFDRIRVGARYYSGGSQGSFFPGDIAKSTLYNRALSAAEVAQNFEAFRGRFGL